jgi:hypothetical protein
MTECVKESNQTDRTKKQAMRAWHIVPLLTMIEVGEKSQGPFDDQIRIEFAKQCNASMCCPRETICFFHRRNSCDCLHEVYYNYKLKDATQRTFG